MAMLEVVAHLRANADNMVSGFRRAQGAAEGFGQSVDRSTGLMRNGFTVMSRMALLGAGAMQTAAMAGATMGIKFAMANEQAIISFKTLLGSQQAAEGMFKDLQQFAASTPFEFPQLRDAASKLLTTGVEAERVIPIMTALGDSTAAMGTGAEGIQRAVYALQQMNLVGAVKGQDMMQLANAGIPAWDALASAAKMSVQEVKKAVENGTLQNSVPLLMSGIENYSGAAMQRVKGMMVEQSTTLTGLMSTLKDNINIALGDMMKPATQAIKEALPSINDAVGKTFKAMTKPINDMVTVAMEAFSQLVPAIEPMMSALSTIMVAMVRAVVPALAQMASVLPSLQPALVSIGQAISDVSAIIAPLVVQLVVGFVPIIAQAATVVSGLTGFIRDHIGVLEALSPVLGALVAGYVALKVATKINMFISTAKTIGGLILQVLGLTTAVGAETAATLASAAANAANAVSVSTLAMTMGGGAQAAAAYAAALTAQTAVTDAAAVANGALAATFWATPIPWIVAGVAALVVGFVLLWRKFEGFRNFWKSTWNVIVSGTQLAINAILKYFQFFINNAIRGVNLLIRAWNALPFGKDIPTIKHLNLELDLTGAKIDMAAKNAYTLADGLMVAEAAAKGTYESSQQIAKNMANLKSTLSLGQGAGGTNEKRNKQAQELGGGGGKGGGVDKMKQLIDAAKKLGTDALSKAQGFFTQIKKKADDFAGSVRNAMMAVWSFSDAFATSQKVSEEYAAQMQVVADAERQVNDALASKDMTAYAEAIRQYTSATQQLNSIQGGRTTFMQALRKQYEDALRFGDVIARLRAASLNEAGISQVLAAGAEAGTQIGEEILAGGQEAVANANQWYDELVKASNLAADAAKDQFYKQGLSQGEQLVKGITDAAKKLNLSLSSKGLSKAQILRLQKDFGVDIQFKMADLSNLATPMAKGGIVRARSGGTLALLGEAGRDEAVIPLGRGGAGVSSITNYNTIYVNGGDPNAVVDALKKYMSINGRVPIKVLT